MNVPDGAYGFVYITTNNLNGRMYVGQKKIDDWGVWKNYLGSGKAFKQAVKKYGKENFEREVLGFAYSPEDLNRMEAEYILDLDCVSDPQYYNLVEGGTVTGMIHSERTKDIMREKAKGRVASEETKRKMSASQKSRFSNPKNKIKYPTISVTCITTGVTFKSIKEAAEFYNIKSPSAISSACKGTRKSAGKLPEGTCLKWKYCDEKTPR